MSRWLQWACVLVLAILHLALAAKLMPAGPLYPDEDITQAVSERLWKARTLDTNWRRVPKVAALFPGDQYNFSAAILAAQPVAYAVARLTGRDALDLQSLRWSSALFTAAALVLCYLAFRALLGGTVAVIAVALLAVSGQVLAEALYVRPEAFVSMCFAAALYAAIRGTSAGQGSPAWLALCGLFLGLLVATKFSLAYAAAHIGLVALVLEADRARAPLRAAPLARWLAPLAIGAVAGFCLGAPMALTEPAAVPHGWRALITQYSTGHLPFGRPNAAAMERAGFALHQIVAVHGVALLALAGLGAAMWMRARARLAAAVLLPPLAFVAFFGLTQVFFERNFSFYLPLLYAMGAYGAVELARALPASRAARMGMGVAALAVAIAVPGALFARLAFDVVPGQLAHLDDVARREVVLSANLEMPVDPDWQFLSPVHAEHFAGVAERKPPQVYKLVDLADPYSAESTRILLARFGWRVVAYEPSVLAGLGVPTLDLAHGKAYRYVAPPHAHLPASRPFADVATLCVRALDLPTQGGFAGGVAEASPARFAFAGRTRGTWGTSDADLGEVVVGPFVPPANTFVALATGPEREGISAFVREAGSGRELARLPARPFVRWIAWRLPETRVPIEIVLRDAGREWGQWIAVAGRALGPRGSGC